MLIIVDDTASTTSYRSRRRHREDLLVELADDADEDEEAFQATGVSLRAIAKLLGLLPPGVALSAAEVAKLCPAIVLRIASAAERCQGEQETVLYRSVMRLFGDIPRVSKSVSAFATQIVDDATTGNSFMTVTKLRHAIIGPVKSGKSVFLKVLGEAVLNRFIASGQYRKTLIWYADLRDAADAIADPLALYRLIVRTTFHHLSAQRLELQPYKDSLITYFERLPTLDKVVPLPGKFAIDDDFRGTVPLLTVVADHIFDSLSQLHSLNVWLTNAVAFPRAAALAFGFTGVHFIVDHLEIADFEVDPTDPLDAEPQAVTVTEYFKFMLSNDSFVVSGSDEVHLIESLELLTEDGLDLRDGLECISITDVDTDHHDRFQFTLRLANDEQPVALRMVDCGGCSGYLSHWDPIVEQAARVKAEEKKDEHSRVAKELRLELLTKIREIASLLFWRFDDAEGRIVPLNKQIVAFDIIDTSKEIPEGEAPIA
jgi:hypothetical protein